VASNSNWVERLGGWLNHKVDGNQQTWIDGNLEELKVGTSTEITTGELSESHAGLKFEFIFGAEFKVNVGHTDELCCPNRVEVIKGHHKEYALGPRLEFMPRHGRVIRARWMNKMAEANEEIARATRLIANYERSVTTMERSVMTLERSADRLERWVDYMAEKCKKVEIITATTNLQTDTHKRRVKSAETHAPGSFAINSGGAVELDGNPAEMVAGVTVQCTRGKVTANGTDIVVKP
jgi:hypothetical protein